MPTVTCSECGRVLAEASAPLPPADSACPDCGSTRRNIAVTLDAAQLSAASMPVTVRPMQPHEARRFLAIHHESVRGLAANDYPRAVIESWAPVPITDERLQRFLQNRDNEIRLVADLDGESVGIGALVLANAELRACYVLPTAARRGVGSAIVSEIERIAREHGIGELHLESSVTAEPFYAALDYDVEKRGALTIAPGVMMAAITMRKKLTETFCVDR